MSERGSKLRRIRRLLGAGLPAAGVTRVRRPARPAARGDAPGAPGPGAEAATAVVDPGDSGRIRTVGVFGAYRGAHRRTAA